MDKVQYTRYMMSMIKYNHCWSTDSRVVDTNLYTDRQTHMMIPRVVDTKL